MFEDLKIEINEMACYQVKAPKTHVKNQHNLHGQVTGLTRKSKHNLACYSNLLDLMVCLLVAAVGLPLVFVSASTLFLHKDLHCLSSDFLVDR